MRKLPISKRPILVMACVVLAIALNLALTRFGHQVAVTYCDYRVEVKKGPHDEPIIPFGFSVADTFCMGQMTASEKPRRIAAFSETYGIFAARNIPAKIALWGGVLAPFAVIICAAYVALRALLFPARTIAILTGSTLGILTAALVISDFVLIGHVPTRYWINYLWPLVLPLGLFLGVYWLWRTRSPKQPA